MNFNKRQFTDLRRRGTLPTAYDGQASDPIRIRVSKSLYYDRSRDSWLYRYKRNGKQYAMGLGPVRNKGLEAARAEVIRYELERYDGLDPATERLKRKLANEGTKTFEQAAAEFFRDRSGNWRNEKHRAQWTSSLETYAKSINRMPVTHIEVHHLKKLLDPIWRTKTETATRVLQRIGKVLDYASAMNWRTGDNPAHKVRELLGPPKKMVRHQPSLHYSQIHDFVRELRTQEGIAAVALELLIQTGHRTTPVVGARWCEFDLDQRVWTVPGERMKNGKVHRTPLTNRVVRLLTGLDQPGEYVFPSPRDHRQPLSNMALIKLLRRMNHDSRWTDANGQRIVPHGFRSTMRDYFAEHSNFPEAVVKRQLAQNVGGRVDQAYFRTDLLDRRRRLLDQWTAFIESPPRKADIVLMRASS